MANKIVPETFPICVPGLDDFVNLVLRLCHDQFAKSGVVYYPIEETPNTALVLGNIKGTDCALEQGYIVL